MDQVIEETLEIAKKKFISFGFKEEQITQLLASGKRDLEKELSKLATLLEEDTYNFEQINQSLHALKGLFFNMGNTVAGDMMAELRKNDDPQASIDKIRQFLGEGKSKDDI
jgi:hypothetical protein